MYTQFAMLQIPSATKLQEGRIMEAKNTKNWWYYSNKYLIHIFFILLLHDVIFHISIDELLNHLFKNICSNFWIFLELYKLHSKSLHVHAYIYRVTVHFGSNYKFTLCNANRLLKCFSTDRATVSTVRQLPFPLFPKCCEYWYTSMKKYQTVNVNEDKLHIHEPTDVRKWKYSTVRQ